LAANVSLELSGLQMIANAYGSDSEMNEPLEKGPLGEGKMMKVIGLHTMARRLDPLGKILFGKKSLHRKNLFRFGKIISHRKKTLIFFLSILLSIEW